MKYFRTPFLWMLSFLWTSSLFAQVSGTAFLTGQTDHSGIAVIFTATSVSGQTDTAYTQANGDYSLNLVPGVYEIEFQSNGYQSFFYNQNQPLLLNGSEILDPVTLPPGAVRYVSGAVSGTWSSDTTYIANGDLIIPSGTLLTIEAGTEVRFEPNFGMEIVGRLQAIGTETDSIRFTIDAINPAPNSWTGLTFSDLSTTTSLAYCIVEYAEYPIYTDAHTFIPVNESILRFSLRNSTIRYGTSGIRLDTDWRSEVVENDIYGFEYSGVGFYGYGGSTINMAGPYLISCNRIHGNGSSAIASFLTVANAHITGNEIYDMTGEYGINLWRGNGGAVIVENNVISETGIGIGESSPSSAPAAIIRNNVVFNSDVGLQMGSEGGTIVQMNVLVQNTIGFYQFNSVPGTPAEFSYNLISQNDTNYSNEVNLPFIGELITTNANGDSVDAYFNLDQDPQLGSNNLPLLGSPLVDAGEPSQTDVDSSVRDIGLSPDALTCWDTQILPRPVYPGDANFDQIANVWDVLPIGLTYGQTGPPRLNASLNWEPQDADGWGDTLAAGIDIKHADVDGNGLIEAADTLGIVLNYGSTHTEGRGQTQPNGVPLYLDMPVNQTPGDTLAIPIMLGNMDTLAQNLYGLAFAISYDTSLVAPNSVKVHFANSWMGTDNVDMLTLYHDDFSLAQVEIGMVRTDGIEVSGFGQIATLIVVMDDDIAKQSVPFELSWGQVNLIQLDESPIAVSPQNAKTEIQTSMDEWLDAQLSVYPNPAQDQVIIRLDQAETDFQVRLLDYSGRMLLLTQLSADQPEKQIEVASFASGIYLLQLLAPDQSMITRKVVIE
ncbi:MAG: T9SS type A sorting domain-containing protein [Bacteroidota bacterium]